MTTKQYRHLVVGQLHQLEVARLQRDQEKEALAAAQERKDNLSQVLVAAQELAQQIQEEAHHRIADIVSRSLKAVFDDPYTFKINFVQKRGKTEAELVFERNGMELDPLSSSGGGVVDVAAFALRLSCLLLSQPPVRKVLLLDEPFRFVSADYRERVRVLLEQLVGELGVQIVLVTHITELQTGTVISL